MNMDLILEKILNNSGRLSFLAIIAAAFFLAGVLTAGIIVGLKAKKWRKETLKRSRAVLGGLAGEQVAPYLPGFPCNPADVRFIGKPIDYLGFAGASEGNEIKEILFIEVKTGQSQLSEREREIKNLVQKGKVRYVEYRLK